MDPRVRLAIRYMVAKILIVTIAAAIIGMLAGVVTLYAETRNGLYVSGVGNVASASTSGYSSGGTQYAYGRSTSSVSLYQIVAHVRFWHQSTGGNILQSQDRREWTNSTGGFTNTIATVGYGDRAATQSFFRPAWTSGNTYYTSWPDYFGSCYTYWSSGNNC